MLNEDVGVIINLNSNYSNYQFDFRTFPVLLSIFPFLYMIPTCFVTFRIIEVFIKKGVRKHDETINRNVFLVIILSQLTCLCYFFCDFVMIRLPSTGILTSWCQRNPPNLNLTIFFTSHMYFSYPLMIYPVLLAIVRYTPIHYPHKHHLLNTKILSFSIPIIHFYPFPFLFFMFPALGVCRQLKPPYPFGSAFIHFIESWHGIRNCMMKYKFKHILYQGTFLIDYQLGIYTSFLRPYGNDLETSSFMDMNNVSIQGNLFYINYEFNFFTFPVLVACIPLSYLIPTFFIIFKVFKVYIRQFLGKRDDTINPHVFLVIVASQITSIFYMISDYITIRLPFSGILTSWCASQEPNHLLKLLFFFSIYFTFISWLFPFLLSALRLIPVYFPRKHSELCARITKFALPSIYFYPLIFTFTLIPAMGTCRQLLGPYQFGAIFIWFTGNWFDLKLINGIVLNLAIWLILCSISNLMLYKKLKKLKSNRKSVILQRAEMSLTLTTFSMLLSFLTNLFCAMIFLILPSLTVYFIALRPFANDCEIVFAPWIFYLTHPIFKKKQQVACMKEVSRVGTLHTTY
ncbi:Protein CBG03351 [Caenorhabditis briggsae]|uniref:Protein CBG03351 n=1 Tax=Caenorhabditis briggsae TaxID=6238 RepID=A8WUU6_CAEBR|nr:Protein CBG03351 [Caenorhabditis briggsae]CAP24258.2 Protein CBG03351 [Caenorhabditis briggsae]